MAWVRNRHPQQASDNGMSTLGSDGDASSLRAAEDKIALLLPDVKPPSQKRFQDKLSEA